MTPRHENRLARETSPYLLQHAHNPVDWWPWCPEARELARREDKPIFLSIGYSACHWCHVMERESFESDEIAELLNRHFVPIKVDREERPDLDDLYMKYVTSSTGSGGWPMSVFLTPEGRPFFGGTYFPPQSRFGRPGFREVLTSLAAAWTRDRRKIDQAADWFDGLLARETRARTEAPLNADILEQTASALLSQHDPTWGGFGSAPKFPHATDLRLLMRHAQRSGSQASAAAVRVTLDRMARGGIYDQLGGGFHRYSTDAEWRIPHFEKMLYDNALLVPAYLEGFLATGRAEWARVARECCDWMLREMATPEGGFASSQDADSEGVEGRYFVWTCAELEAVLGPERGRQAAVWWGLSEEGNFEDGTNALWRPEPAEQVAEELGVGVDELESWMEEARQKLLSRRAERVPPGTDDKVLAAWNGLAVSALSQAAQVLGSERYQAAAEGAARFVLERMRQSDGRLFATARQGRAHLNGTLDDYAFVIAGLLDLYETDFDPDWVRTATDLASVCQREFADTERGGWFTTGASHEPLLARLRSPQDGALPSGASVQALNLLRLAELTGRAELSQLAESAILSAGQMLNRYPQGFAQMILAADFAASPMEVVIAGAASEPDTRALLEAVRATFRPQRVVALADERADPDLMPLLQGRSAGPGGARAYVCRNWTCQEPVATPGELRAALSAPDPAPPPSPPGASAFPSPPDRRT